jgi:intracellular sulfur oxidation DsrE/DsrF family protein
VGYGRQQPTEETIMTITTRRGVIGAIAASGATLAASRVNAAPQMLSLSAVKKETDVACLYHCDFGDPRRFAQMLTNINNHLSVYEFDTFKIKLVIVAHGAGVKFFLKDLSDTPYQKETVDPDLYKRFVGLSKFGVEAYLCQITFKRQKMDIAKAHEAPFIKLVPSGVATVAELQGKGFAYLKVG